MFFLKVCTQRKDCKTIPLNLSAQSERLSWAVAVALSVELFKVKVLAALSADDPGIKHTCTVIDRSYSTVSKLKAVDSCSQANENMKYDRLC